MDKAKLNRKIQVLESALEDLTKAHNRIVDDINERVQCEECRKVKVEYAKTKKVKFAQLYATLLGAFTPTDYSQEPHKLFEDEVLDNE